MDLINFTRQTKCKNRETKTGRNRINQSNGERERERERERLILKKREKRGQSCNMWYGESEETKKKTDVAYFVQHTPKVGRNIHFQHFLSLKARKQQKEKK